tara:strand:- start:123 stop:326 length:204 start_codon:yes stop_codon:yes gene_type:complete
MIDDLTKKEKGFPDDFDESEEVSKEEEKSCKKCGKQIEWFIHRCQSIHQLDEIHGCSSCDNHCIFCL